MNDHAILETVAPAELFKGISFAVEPLHGDDFATFRALQEDHYQEVAGFRSALDRLNPDWDKYEQMQKTDRLHLVKARLGGELVGYSAHMVYQHLHYKHVLCAEDDVHYIRPHLRTHGIGQAMRAFAIRTLRERGVKLVLARFKINH